MKNIFSKRKTLDGNNSVLVDDKINQKELDILIKGKNNQVVIKTSNVINCKIEVFGDNNFVCIEEETEINNLNISIKSSDFIHIKHSKIAIGKKTIIRNTSITLQGDNTRVSIGDSTTILGCHFFAVEYGCYIDVGIDCMFSYNIEVRTSDWHAIYDKSNLKRINNPKSVHIGNHVWVGSYVMILKGVSIGNNGVIGTNSVVTKSSPPNCAIAGNPAKIIKKNICWDRRNQEHKTKENNVQLHTEIDNIYPLTNTEVKIIKKIRKIKYLLIPQESKRMKSFEYVKHLLKLG